MTPIANRPLTIGEIFDRGITLFVRNAPVVMLLAASYYVPSEAIEAHFAPSPSVNAWDAITALATNTPRAHGTPSGASLLFSYRTLYRFVDIFILWPLLEAALAAALGTAYRGTLPNLVGTLRIAARSWRPATYVAFASLFMLGGALLVSLLVLGASGAVGTWAAREIGFSGWAYSIAVGIVVAPSLALGLVCYLFFETVRVCATCSVVVERLEGEAAFTASLRRTLESTRRSIAVRGALVVILWVTTLLASTIGSVIGDGTHLPFFAIAVRCAGWIAATSVTSAIMIVFYEDQRLRSEGDDLAAAASSAARAPETVPA